MYEKALEKTKKAINEKVGAISYETVNGLNQDLKRALSELKDRMSKEDFEKLDLYVSRIHYVMPNIKGIEKAYTEFKRNGNTVFKDFAAASILLDMIYNYKLSEESAEAFLKAHYSEEKAYEFID